MIETTAAATIPNAIVTPPQPPDDSQKASHWLRWALVCVAVLLLSLASWWWLRAPSTPAVAVRLAPLIRTLQFTARVATLSRVDVGSTITGRVLRVEVMEGDAVRRGDSLVQLESEELTASLGQAEASQHQAAATLAGIRSTGRTQAQAGVAQADSVVSAAHADFVRMQDLAAKGFISDTRLDDARRASEVAGAQQTNARAQRKANAEQGTDVAQARAQLSMTRSATAAARARLAQVVLSAPADARVLVRMVEPGQIVQPGHALLTLALAGPVQLVAQVDERFLEELAVGQSASVLADAFPERPFTARVQSIAPLVDTKRGAIEVKFLLTGAAPDFLREDMTLSVEVETARRTGALVIPLAALRDEGHSGRASVLIEQAGHVQVRAVHVGIRTLEAVEVLDGLNAGDTVLLGVARKSGSRVRADTKVVTLNPAARSASDGTGAAMTNSMGR